MLPAAALAIPAAAQEVRYSGGVRSATGSNPFTERTTKVALLSGLTLALWRLRLAATLPLLCGNSTAVTCIGGTPVPRPRRAGLHGDRLPPARR